MINPSQAWCLQISVCSTCWPKTDDRQPTGCSNCTRGLAHERKRYVMSLEHIEQALQAVAAFGTESAPCPQGRRKVVGLFGAEPFTHQRFPEVVDLFVKYVPDPWHRGLWTSFDWPTYISPVWGPALPHVRKLLGPKIRPEWGPHRETHIKHFPKYADRDVGYLNWNQHHESQKCEHQPLWVSISDVVPSEAERWELISNCWVQREWSPIVAYDHHNRPKFWFCEVASAHDRLFDLGTGLDLDPDCWRATIRFERDEAGILRPVGKYRDQILSCCTDCGAALPMPGRRDLEFRDDISATNLERLRAIGSPMVARGDFVAFDDVAIAAYNAAQHQKGWKPEQYVKVKGIK